MRPVLLLVLFAALAGAPRSEASFTKFCGRALAWAGSLAGEEFSTWRERPIYNALTTLASLPYYGFYLSGKLPVLGAVNMFQRWKSGKREPLSPFRLFKHELIPFTIYLALTALDANPAELLTKQVFGVYHDRLIDPATYYTTHSPVVGANGTDIFDPLGPTLSHLAGQGYHAPNEGRYFIESSDMEVILQKLLEVHKKHGPIQAWTMASHGFPGRLLMSRVSSDDDVDENWIEEHAELLKSMPDDLFAPGATITVLACEPGFRFFSEGENPLIDRFFKPMLKKGGRIRIANRIVYINRDLIPAEAQAPFRPYRGIYEAMEDHYIKAGMAVYATARWLLAPLDQKFEKIATIEVEPQ